MAVASWRRPYWRLPVRIWVQLPVSRPSILSWALPSATAHPCPLLLWSWSPAWRRAGRERGGCWAGGWDNSVVGRRAELTFRLATVIPAYLSAPPGGGSGG